MTFRNVLALMAVTVCGVACGSTEQAETMPAVDLVAEEQAVRGISTRWLELETAKDAAGITALIAEDGILFRPNEAPTIGSQAIEAMFNREYENNPDIVVTFGTDELVMASSADLAVEHGSFTVTNAGPDGTESDEGHYVTAHRKIDGEWKVIMDMFVSSVPQED